eukprot:2945442-Rhodomonas_salina.1
MIGRRYPRECALWTTQSSNRPPAPKNGIIASKLVSPATVNSIDSINVGVARMKATIGPVNVKGSMVNINASTAPINGGTICLQKWRRSRRPTCPVDEREYATVLALPSGRIAPYAQHYRRSLPSVECTASSSTLPLVAPYAEVSTTSPSSIRAEMVLQFCTGSGTPGPSVPGSGRTTP